MFSNFHYVPIYGVRIAFQDYKVEVRLANSYFTEMIYLRDESKYPLSLALRRLLWLVEALQEMLLIFIFGSIRISQMFSFMEEELKDSTDLQLKQIVDNLEDNLNDFSEVSNRICVDSKLQKEVFLNQGNSALNGIKQLQNYKYKLVDILFLCYNEDEIYTTDGKITAATLANGTLKYMMSYIDRFIAEKQPGTVGRRISHDFRKCEQVYKKDRSELQLLSFSSPHGGSMQIASGN